MSRNWKSTATNTLRVAAAFAAMPLFSGLALSQAQNAGESQRSLISERIDESRLVTLLGNLRSAANSANDRGRVEDNLPLDHMLLQLKRSPEQERALEQLIDQLHDPSSPSFHHWMTAEQLGRMFGPSAQDITTITGWLGAHGLVVNLVYPDRMMIDFSGSAGAVREAFRTEIHRLNVNGESHIANMTNPQIPAALAPVVAGVVSLHDFRPRTMLRMHPSYTFTASGATYEAVVPADLATIYDFKPLFSGGTTGKGQTIALIEDTNLYSTADWSTFVSKFGLSTYGGTLSTVHPAPASGTNNCSNPGVVVGNDGEAALDVEWATAAAPGAAVEVASCKDTSTTFGGLIALQNLLSASNPPAIVSISYGECEAENGVTANAAYNSTFETAAAAGVSVFVSAGDEGAASCDADLSNATHGIGVSGFASTAYNVAAGGTDFGDTYAGTNSSYWSSSNSATYGSALSYIPEIPWNDSCASSLIYTYLGYSAAYGTSGFCNTSTGKNDFLTTAAGSGGPSGCATGSPSTSGVVSGSCKGYPKPSWQMGVTGIPNDGVRDLPDVSLFAANGVWGHYYVFCYTDTRGGGASCSGAPSTWAGAGGTSFASPILAGIQALVNQQTGHIWGNPNTVYYQLAASTSNVFHDVTLGDIDVNCSGTNSCYGASTTKSGIRTTTVYGVLSTSDSSLAPAYKAGSGWDFATGLGSVDVNNLVTAWNAAFVAASVKPVK